MFAYISRGMKRLSALIILILLANLLLIPANIARAAISILITNAINEPSPLPQDRFSYQEFRNITKTFSRNGGDVCISSSPTSCAPIQMDDGFKVSVNGRSLGDFLSRTQPLAPVNVPSQYLSSFNSLNVILYDVQGPYRGGNALYIVLDAPSSPPWPANCSPIDYPQLLRDKTDFEIFLARTSLGRHYAAWNYTIGGELCNLYGAPADTDLSNGYTVGLQGTLNGQTYSLEINPKGSITGGNVTFSETATRTYMGNTDCKGCKIEWGVEIDRKIGNRSTMGIDLSQTSRVLDRFKQQDEGQNINIALEFAPNKNLIYAVFMALGVLAVRLINGATAPALILMPPLIKSGYGLPDQQPGITSIQSGATKPSTFTTFTVAEQIVPDEVRQAAATKAGALINYTTLNSITSRSRISAYTKFDYETTGFTPNGPVVVTFGFPDGNRDLFWQIVKADSTGKIKSTIEMPPPASVTYGRYLLMAMDYESAEDSLYRFFADPEHPNIQTTMAAMLIDVVPDITPPVTTAYAIGPLDSNKIFRDTVTIRLDATDDLSGVARTEYSLNGGQSWTTIGIGNTFTISGNGITQFLYRSVDKYGNVEAAKDSGPIIINKYVIFANDGGSSSLLINSNTGVTITGNAHTNGSAKVTYNTNVKLNDVLTRVGSITNRYNTSTTIPSQQSAAVPLLSYPLAMYEQRSTVVKNGDWYINSTAQALHGLYYVKGNVYIDATTVDGNLTIVATGNIIDRSTTGSFVNTDPRNGIMYYAGGNIEIQSTKSNYLGLLYAPNGTVNINGLTNGTFRGSFVGKYVQIKYATTLTVLYDAGFASGTYQLPLQPPIW